MNKRNIIVTGADSGIGLETCRSLINLGFFIIMIGRNSAKLLQAQSKIDPDHQNSNVLSCDLTRRLAIKQAITLIRHSKIQIYGLINAAGVGYFEKVLDTTDMQIEQTFETNTLGLIYLTKYVARLMVHQGFGHIINVASMAGKIITPKAAIYGSSKAAVISFSNGLRMELKPYNVLVSTVNTGPVKTPFLKKADLSENYAKSVQKYLLDPQIVGEKIAQLLIDYRRELNLPWYMELAAKLYPLFPQLGDYLSGDVFNKK